MTYDPGLHHTVHDPGLHHTVYDHSNMFPKKNNILRIKGRNILKLSIS